MLFQIAWRNLFRNRLRSFVIMAAIALGICVGIFFLAFSWGLMDQRGRDIIDTQISHIQIHQEGFSIEDSANVDIAGADALMQKLQNNPNIEAASGRTLRTGMVASSRKSMGVLVQGIVPEDESKVTTISQKMVQGGFLGKKGRNPIVIGEGLAEELGVKLRSKITLTFYRNDGEITSAAFRVAGTYKTAAGPFDKMNVFIKQADIQRIMGGDLTIHEVAIRLKNPDTIFETQTALKTDFPSQKIEYWGEIQPTLQMMNEQFDISVGIFMGVIIFALLFGILNTMLMAVLERRKELGMLMAVGMKRNQIFSMIMIETVLLAVVGAAIGMLAGWGIVSWFGVKGIPLSSLAEGLASMGMSDVVYTKLDTPYYIQTAVMMVIAALIAAIPPARRALKLNPVEAIRN